jgi:hypothetical protein
VSLGKKPATDERCDEKRSFSRKRSDKTETEWSHRQETIKCKPGSLLAHDSTTIQRLERLGVDPKRWRRLASKTA